MQEGAVETAQWIKHLLQNYTNLSLNPQGLCKS